MLRGFWVNLTLDFEMRPFSLELWIETLGWLSERFEVSTEKGRKKVYDQIEPIPPQP
jgi:hypothetical protein